MDLEHIRKQFAHSLLNGVDSEERVAKAVGPDHMVHSVIRIAPCKDTGGGNFEWRMGCRMRFGLISVDRTTMERTPKPSLAYLGSYPG